MIERCVECGRDYAWPSKPRWVFDDCLQPVATVHTSCATAYRKANGLPWHRVYFSIALCLKQGQKYAWLWGMDPIDDVHVRMYFAGTETDRANHRDWWVKGPLQLSPEQMSAIVETAEDLERRFDLFMVSGG